MRLKVTEPRPYCKECHVKEVAAIQHYYNSRGKRTHTAWRPICTSCHEKKVAAGLGMSVLAYKNSHHPYLKHRKDFCENRDSRLGFKCTTKLPSRKMLKMAGCNLGPESFLEVDHIDGDHTNNDVKNLQTLCKNCHAIKTNVSRDYRTPGRKSKRKAA
jgi:5-methylcytosine-specific restriction endonuclease McrA